MTAARRFLVLLALTVVAVLGAGSTAANATFSASAALPGMTVGTGTVAAPGNVTAELRSCSNARWRGVAVGWEPSGSRGVSGYRVRAYLGDGRTVTVAQTGATTTGVTVIVDKFIARPASVAFTVTTLTSYGWTATSPMTSAPAC